VDGEVQKKKEETKKKEKVEPQKMALGSKKKATLESKKRENDTKKHEESKKWRDNVRNSAVKRKVDKDPVNNLPGPPTPRTSLYRALTISTSRDESPPRTVSSGEWWEFLDYCRRTAASRPPFQKYKKDY